MSDTIQSVLGPSGAISLGGDLDYEHRPQQIRMAEAIALALEGGGVLLIEAGTGTGKTLAYLTAIALSGRQVVVSTGTKNLQDQLLGDDIPLLERALGRSLSAVALKGLGNYLCLRKLAAVTGAEALLDPVERAALALIRRWAEATETGDRAELTELPEGAPLWAELCSSTETRLGHRCRFYEDCFVTRARRAAQEARLIVVNHHLFFADLSLRGGSATPLLPDYDALIFDEAHQIDGIATSFFGYRVSSRQLDEVVRDTQKALAAVAAAGLSSGDEGDRSERLLDQLRTSAAAFFATVEATGDEPGRTPLLQSDLQGAPETCYFRLDSALEALTAHLGRLSTRGAEEHLGVCARRASALRDDLGEILGAQRATSVYWKEAGPQSVAVGASPIDVSTVLRELVFYKVDAVALTSATLAVEGSFDFTRARLGIDFDVDELLLPSPFDYRRQAALYLPRRAADPRHPGALERVVELLLEAVEVIDGGTLALFTSRRDMHRAAAMVREGFSGLVRVQGERPRRALIEELRGATAPLILLATASFWEGIDVPGDALRLVAIARLPFASPGDPVVAARLGQLEEEGRNPFLEYQVPQASLALKQGFGRLIRTQRDRGVVAVLDRRIQTMSYGEVFLRSLPDCATVGDLEALRDWWLRG